MKRLVLFSIAVLLLATFVKSESFEEAKIAIDEAEKIVKEIVKSNFSSVAFNEILKSMREDFLNRDYEAVLKKFETIKNRADTAFYLHDSLVSASIRIQELKSLGADTKEAEKILSNALREFRYENYEEALKLADELFTAINDLDAKQSIIAARYEAGKNKLVEFLFTHRLYIFIAVMLILIVSIPIYRISKKVSIKRDIKNLEKKKKVLENLIYQLQEKRYVEDTVSKRVYDTMMPKYKAELRKLESKIFVAKRMLK